MDFSIMQKQMVLDYACYVYVIVAWAIDSGK